MAMRGPGADVGERGDGETPRTSSVTSDMSSYGWLKSSRPDFRFFDLRCTVEYNNAL